MYPTVCPPRGPGHNSSLGELIYLTVCPPGARVMIAQWENECNSLSVLPMALVQFPAAAEYFKGSFSG